MADTRLDMLLEKEDWDLLAEASRQGSERVKRLKVAERYGWKGPDGGAASRHERGRSRRS